MDKISEFDKKISVVIPLYNKSADILATLDSVLAQTFSNFEIVVVDDGSTDNSLELARSVSDSRVRVFEQKNQGVSVARNRGIEEALGNYIAFLDADDYWYSWHLDELNNLISKHPGRGVYSVAHEIQRGGKIYYPAQFCSSGFSGVVDDFFEAFSRSLSLVNSSTACMSRDLLLKLGGFPVGIKKGEDVYVWLKAAINSGLVYSDRVCSRYNQDAQFRSNISFSEEIPFYLSWLDELVFSDVVDSCQLPAMNKFLRLGIFYNAAGYLLVGNEEAFKNLSVLKASKKGMLKYYLLVIGLLPRGVLKLAQKFRHG